MAKILIVDDDASFRFILKDFLEMNGYDCMEAGNVAQARRQLWWNRFDLILSDLNMPKESGFDLLDHVISLYPRTPLLCPGDRERRQSNPGAGFEIGRLRLPFQAVPVE